MWHDITIQTVQVRQRKRISMFNVAEPDIFKEGTLYFNVEVEAEDVRDTTKAYPLRKVTSKMRIVLITMKKRKPTQLRTSKKGRGRPIESKTARDIAMDY